VGHKFGEGIVNEVDIASMPPEVGLAWAAALIELGCEIQAQARKSAHVHEVVSFRRRG
jgi:hypothetical protein